MKVELENPDEGVAERPEPEPDYASSSSATGAASYDPADYQRPHPDDRGGGSGYGKGVATKAHGKSKSKSKAKGSNDGSQRCANCDSPGATAKCGCCGVEWLHVASVLRRNDDSSISRERRPSLGASIG